MKKIFTAIGVIFFVVVIAGLSIFVYSKLPKKVVAESNTLDIQGKINDIGELATAEYVYTISESMHKEGLTIFGKELTSSEVVYSYSGTVKAGLIFSDIKIEVNNDRKQIYVTLPESQILSNELDLNSLEIINEEYSNFNKVTFSDINLSQQSCKDTAKATAIEKGLLDNADENAKKIIESMIAGFYDIKEYTIYFE